MGKRRLPRIYWPSTKARTSIRVSRDVQDKVEELHDLIAELADLDPDAASGIATGRLTNNHMIAFALSLAIDDLREMLGRLKGGK